MLRISLFFVGVHCTGGEKMPDFMGFPNGNRAGIML